MIYPFKHCKKRPRYIDSVIVHPYCGRTCANLAKGMGYANGNAPIPTVAAKPSKTTTPGNTTNPLGTTASTNAINRSISTKKNVPIIANPRNSVIPASKQNNRTSNYWEISSDLTCQTPGCSTPVHVHPNGALSRYCTKAHQQYVFHLATLSREPVLSTT